MNYKATTFFIFFLTFVALLAAAQEVVTESDLQVVEHEALGAYLVDGDELALYLFLSDADGASTCYNTCAENWPPLMAEDDLVLSEGVSEELLGRTERDDGTWQVTYNGWPLYYFTRDNDPGDINGQGVGEVWYLISPAGEAVGLEADAAMETTELLTSVWDGVYSEEQAHRGEGEYVRYCSECHGQNLGGGAGPALAGASFVRTWNGSTVDRLFSYIRTNMPLDEPGSLSDETYIDIVAHMFYVNDFPPGSAELEPNSEILPQIDIEPDPSGP